MLSISHVKAYLWHSSCDINENFQYIAQNMCMVYAYPVHPKNVCKMYWYFAKSKKCFDKTLLLFYHTIVHSHLSQCISVWDRTYATHPNDLTMSQNNIICVINGISPRTNVKKLYVIMGILFVNCIHNCAIGLSIYKLVNNMFLNHLSFFSNVTDLHLYDTGLTKRNSWLLHTNPQEDHSILAIVVLVSENLFSAVWSRILQWVCINLHHINCFANQNEILSKCRVCIMYHPKIMYVFSAAHFKYHITHKSYRGTYTTASRFSFAMYRCLHVCRYNDCILFDPLLLSLLSSFSCVLFFLLWYQCLLARLWVKCSR